MIEFSNITNTPNHFEIKKTKTVKIMTKTKTIKVR